VAGSDIHVVREDLDVRTFFGLGGEIARLLKPHRMHFRDESTVGTPGLPRGLYWGIYLGDERGGAWKIDIWQTNRQAFDLVRRFGEELSARLNDTNRAVILEIKAACCRPPKSSRSSLVVETFWRRCERRADGATGAETILRGTSLGTVPSWCGPPSAGSSLTP
jgi:hypothetical protein